MIFFLILKVFVHYICQLRGLYQHMSHAFFLHFLFLAFLDEHSNGIQCINPFFFNISPFFYGLCFLCPILKPFPYLEDKKTLSCIIFQNFIKVLFPVLKSALS